MRTIASTRGTIHSKQCALSCTVPKLSAWHGTGSAAVCGGGCTRLAPRYTERFSSGRSVYGTVNGKSIENHKRQRLTDSLSAAAAVLSTIGMANAAVTLQWHCGHYGSTGRCGTCFQITTNALGLSSCASGSSRSIRRRNILHFLQSQTAFRHAPTTDRRMGLSIVPFYRMLRV